MKGIMRAIMILMLTVWSFGLWASNLGFGGMVLSKDTLNYGDTLFISTYLVNFSANPFSDSINIVYELNHVENVDRRMFPNPVQGQLLNIAAHDSVILNLKIIISPSYFDVGPDILVIWPSITGEDTAPASVLDTQIVVRPLGTGIINPGNDARIRAYYFDQQVLLRAQDPGIAFNRVRIFDLTGHEILNQHTNGQPIPFAPEPDGFYLVEIYYDEGQVSVCRIVK
jgi:hypothetical protein